MNLTAERERPPVLTAALQQKLHMAFGQLVESPACESALEDFRSAYEYRRQFSWLDESGGSGEHRGGGLPSALEQALATYVVPKPSRTAEHREEQSSACIDQEWTKELVAASNIAFRHQSSLRQFAYRLSRAGIDVTTLDPDALQEHLANALMWYADQQRVGTSRDPF